MRTQLSVAIIAMIAATSAHAGFLFETAPVETVVPAAMATQGQKRFELRGSVGRNVDTSAPVASMGRMNRQKIDLDSKLSSRITQSGEPPAELPTVKGLGRNVSFDDALRQIMPGGWGAFSDQDLAMSQVVSWSGSRTWPMVLHGLLADRDMRAHIDWKNQEVMFFAPALKDELTQPVVTGSDRGVEVRSVQLPSEVLVGAVDTPVLVAREVGAVPVTVATIKLTPVLTALTPVGTPVAAPVAAPVSTPVIAAVAAKSSTTTVEPVKEIVWTLSSEHTLRENLRRWASAANWNLIWNAVSGDSVIDYPVDAKVEFTGELLGSTGAMAKVIAAYSDADYPLAIEFFRGNRVVEVRLHRIPDAKSADHAANGVPPTNVTAAP